MKRLQGASGVVFVETITKERLLAAGANMC